MAKKGLITSLILGAVLTLSLGVYSLVVALVALTTPIHTTLAYAYTSDQKITVFSNYNKNDGNLEFVYSDSHEDWLIENTEDNSYTIDQDTQFFKDAKVGDSFNVKAIATTDKHGSTTTYDVTVYKQGSGESADAPYCVANVEGLLELDSRMSDEDRQGIDNVIGNLLTDSVAGNAYVSIVADIDLAGKDWKGLSRDYTSPFSDVIEGNGHAIKNMSIHVTSDNYNDFVGTMINSSDSKSYSALCVGFIRNTQDAIINGLSVVDANIIIDSELLRNIDVADATYNYVRVGLLVGDARNTQINGKYTQTNTIYRTDINNDPNNGELGAEIQVEEKVTTEHSSVVSGQINGFAYSSQNGSIINGLGGVVGTMFNSKSSSYSSEISNYDVTIDIENSNIQTKNVYIGGVAGEIVGKDSNKIAINNVNVTFTNDTLFNNRNYIGGLAGYTQYANIENVNTVATIRDRLTKASAWVTWMQDSNEDYSVFTQSAGIIARVSDSQLKNITSNTYIDVLASSSAGFVSVKNSTLDNVFTNGTVSGFTATGLTKWLENSNVNYTSEAEETAVATNITLTGWNTAGLAEYVENSSIIGQGNVKANVKINAKGGVQEESIEIQNTMVSAGLVGYFYTTDSVISQEYLLKGINAEVEIKNTINGAGLVAYLGNDSSTLSTAPTARLTVQDCNVNLNVTSNEDLGNRSTTHQVGGAVITIYGVAKLENVDVTISFNANPQPDKKYGVAWFGGLVARIGGEYVTINNCTASGNAYINSTSYTKQYGDFPRYEQLIAGGLVGAIASFNVTIPAGKHPVEDDSSVTVDHVQCINTETIFITNNIADVDVAIDFAVARSSDDSSTCMKEEGYRARSAGSLIGLVMNGADLDNNGEYETHTALDLSTNTVTGTLSADYYTFTFVTKTDRYPLSSMGYGKTTEENTEAKCVGSSYDLVNKATYTSITFPAPKAEEVA